ARGIPVVATRVGGVPEALGRAPDGTRPGVLVRPDDPAALAGALRRWRDDPRWRSRLRRAAPTRRVTPAGWPGPAAAPAAVAPPPGVPVAAGRVRPGVRDRRDGPLARRPAARTAALGPVRPRRRAARPGDRDPAPRRRRRHAGDRDRPAARPGRADRPRPGRRRPGHRLCAAGPAQPGGGGAAGGRVRPRPLPGAADPD